MVQAPSKTTSKTLPKTNQNNSLTNHTKQPHKKMSGANTIKNNRENIAQYQSKSNENQTLKNKIEQRVVQAPSKTTSKTLPKIN
jgi:hypothetical protein